MAVPQCRRSSLWNSYSSSWISSGQGQSSPILKFSSMLICVREISLNFLPQHKCSLPPGSIKQHTFIANTLQGIILASKCCFTFTCTPEHVITLDNYQTSGVIKVALPRMSFSALGCGPKCKELWSENMNHSSTQAKFRALYVRRRWESVTQCLKYLRSMHCAFKRNLKRRRFLSLQSLL